jgi:hypothetical protein
VRRLSNRSVVHAFALLIAGVMRSMAAEGSVGIAFNDHIRPILSENCFADRGDDQTARAVCSINFDSVTVSPAI